MKGRMMKLKPLQAGSEYERLDNGIFMPATEGDTAFCLNLRARSEEGDLMPTPEERILHHTSGRPLGWAARGGTNFLFSQTGSGAVRLECATDCNGATTAIEQDLGNPGAEVKELALCGNFAACLTAEGELFFLYYDQRSGDWSAPGYLPPMPELSACAVNSVELSAQVESVSFRSAVSDMRQGVPYAVQTDISDAARKALSDARRRIVQSNRWTQPVRVRGVLRMRDGSILRLSDEISVEGADWQLPERVSLPLQFEEGKGYTGTAAGEITQSGWQIEVSLSGLQQNDWGELISGVDVYVCDEPDPLLDRMASVTYYQNDAVRHINVLIACMSSDEAETLLAGEKGWHKAVTLDELMPTAVIGRDRCAGEAVSLSHTGSDEYGKVETMTGHGGFLHLGTAHGVITTLRNNPAITADETPTGIAATCIAAQPGRGGAYTRQFVYIFNDDGVLALTHDGNGVHRDCRPVWSGRTGSARRVAQGENCLWVMTDSGNLLHLKDGNARSMIRNLKGCGEVAWNPGAGEVWLIPDKDEWGATLTINPQTGATFRSCIPEMCVRGAEMLTGAYERSGGRFRIILPDPSGRNVAKQESEWLSAASECERQGRGAVRYKVYGKSVDAIISTLVVMPNMGNLLAPEENYIPGAGNFLHLHSARLQGRIVYPTNVVTIFPHTRKRRAVKILHRVKGRFERLCGAEV